MRYCSKLKALPENPAYDVVFSPPYVQKFSKKPNEIPTLGIRMKHHFEKAGIDVGVIDDGPLETEVPPWKLASLTMNLTLSQFKKDSFSGLAFKQLFLEQCERYKSFVKIFTDGSKKEERAAAAMVSQANFANPTQL